MEDFWIIVAVLCAQVALVLLIDGRIDGAFVAGVLGLVAWFLSLRSQITRANAAREMASKLGRDEIGEEDEN